MMKFAKGFPLRPDIGRQQSLVSLEDQRVAGRFTFVWLLTMLCSLGGVIVGNWLVNPYGLYASPTVAGFNQLKTGRSDRDRLIKAAAIIEQKPQHLIIGSSRTRQGIDPDHPLMPTHAYNASLNGITIYELRRYVEHAIANQPNLTHVTIGLDFFMFNGYTGSLTAQATNGLTDGAPATRPNVQSETVSQPEAAPITQAGFADYRLGRSHLSPQDVLATTLSIDALVESYQTLSKSRQSPDIFPDWPDNGFSPHGKLADGNTQWRFEQDLQYYFDHHSQYVLSSESLDNFAQIVAQCKDLGITLTVFISPSHAVQWEAIAATGEWETFEQWKRALVALTPVWDFSGYSDITTEPVSSVMANYADNSHYSKQVGDQVIARLFPASNTQADAQASDFGVRLTPENIDAHLQKIRQAQALWQRQNSDTTRWVRQIKAQTD